MMASPNGDKRAGDVEPDDHADICALTGLTAVRVARRLREVTPDTPLRRAFAEQWPNEADALGDLRVALARRADLTPEIVRALGLNAGVAVRRLTGASANAKLKTVFPELSKADLASPEAAGLGETPVQAIRNAAVLVPWLAGRTQLAERVVRKRLRDAHGAKFLRNLLPERWPWNLGDRDELRALLAALPAETALDVPAFEVWLVGLTGLASSRVRNRLAAASASDSVGDRFVGLAPARSAPAPAPVVAAPRPPPAPPPVPPPATVTPPPKVISGRWRILSIVGQGAFARVYEVEDVRFPTTNRYVLKVAETDWGRIRLTEEYRLAEQLSHSNIITYRHLEHEPGFGTYAVQQFGGISLAALLLQRRAPFPAAEAVAIVEQVALGLDHAHLQNILHLDIKPENILVEAPGVGQKIRITDFGVSSKGQVSARADGQPTLMAGTQYGYTPGYAPLEQVDGKGRKASDQYALARVCCALLLGRGLLPSDQFPRGFRALGAGPNLALAKASNPKPELRFVSCGEFARMLKST
jgi:hypothetical protein